MSTASQSWDNVVTTVRADSPNEQLHPAFLPNMIRYGDDEGPGNTAAILSLEFDRACSRVRM